jgi:hypothetical protein
LDYEELTARSADELEEVAGVNAVTTSGKSVG